MFLLILAAIIQPGPTIDSFDLTEHNSYYSPDGRLVFEQMIFYDWDHRNSRFQVAAWRLCGKHKMRIERDEKNRRTIIRFRDTNLSRLIISQIHIRTFTTHDPELRERSFLQKSDRRGLSK